MERVQNLLSGNYDPVQMQQRLHAFTARAAAVGRKVFRGELTYSAAQDEDVDWTLFDIVGIDYYSYFHHRAQYVAELRQFQKWGKPVAITEFGCLYLFGILCVASPRSVRDPPAMTYNFVNPDAPHRTQARYDLDLASYSIVKTRWESFDKPGQHWQWQPKEAFHTVARRYRSKERRQGRTRGRGQVARR